MNARYYKPEKDEEFLRLALKERGTSEKDIEQTIREASPYGVTVIEGMIPVGFIFLYLSLGIGVAFAHELVMDAGVTPRKAREIGTYIMEGLEHICREHDYSKIYTNVKRPALARELVKQGWIQDETAPNSLAYLITN